MRTWYRAGHAFFVKGSLNVRITNCVRKNAWYELQSSLIVDRLMQRLQGRVAGLDMVREPGALSWAPPAASAEDERWFREQTGAICARISAWSMAPTAACWPAPCSPRDTRLQPLLQDFLSRCAVTVAWKTAQRFPLGKPASIRGQGCAVVHPCISTTASLGGHSPRLIIGGGWQAVSTLKPLSLQRR